MSNVQNLPTKSELYNNSNQTKDEESFITLNIYNHNNKIIEESNYDNSQTRENLNLENNFAINNKKETIEDLRKKAMYLDNIREYPYPLSEYRGVDKPAPPQIYNMNNNYTKSLNPVYQDKININKYNLRNNYINAINPYYQDEINNNKYNLNNVPISTENELKIKNAVIKQNANIIIKEIPKKRKKKWLTCKEICIFMFLFFVFCPSSILYLIVILNVKDD